MLLYRSEVPVLNPEKPWEIDGKLRVMSVIPDAKQLRLYYRISFPKEPQKNMLCVAFSGDGFTWERPEFADGTNVVMRSSGQSLDWGVFCPQRIIKNTVSTDPAQAWLMTYWERLSADVLPGICLAASPDGINWQPLVKQSIITSMNDAASFVQTHPEPQIPLNPSQYFIYQQTWKYNPDLPRERDNLKAMHRVISIWVCRHFPERWIGPVMILEPDEHDPPDLQFYHLVPFLTKSGYAGLLHGHHTTEQTMDIQLVTSPDGWNWQRAHERQPVLPLAEDGRFDCGMVYTNTPPVLWNGELLLYYNGRPSVHDGKMYASQPTEQQGIGLAIYSEALLPLPLEVTYVSRTGRTQIRTVAFPGFYGWIRDWDVGGTYTDTQPCPACHGAKLRPEFLSVTLAEKNIHELSELPLAALREVSEKIEITQSSHSLPREMMQNHLRVIQRRLKFLCQVGLNYLNLYRVLGTLSAGEAQRIRLAGALGSQMTALTVLLDEPTRGLHPREVRALLEALQMLRDEGNTVIVVEHDPLVIRAADFLLDIGPGAGASGGQIVAAGVPEKVLQAETITAQWLRNERQVQLQSAPPPEKWLKIFGATENNLKINQLAFPLNRLVGICGVSGSGKSTLLIDTLGRVLAPKKQTTSVAYEPITPGRYEKIEGAPKRTILIDQSKAGVTSPVDFLKLTQRIHKIFAESADALALGIEASRLTRCCSACKGQGVLQLDMGFLPAVRTDCEVCRGTGYPPEAWDVKIQGISLPELMQLTFDEIAPVFHATPLKSIIETVQAVGLGYLVLRQPGVSLSGGEAQRLKIVQELSRKTQTGTLYILDEPTVGQHLEDLNRLIGVLRKLVTAGHSVFVVEHHAHFLAACDWIVELGPGGGPDGGHVIASGAPVDICRGTTPIVSFLREIREEK